MSEIFGLTFPLFGRIFLGFGAGKLRPVADQGLAWLNLFVIYFALPALFFQLLSKTPVSEFANGGFIIATTLAAYFSFALSFGIGTLASRGNIPESTIQALAGSYGNIGYMGPGLAIAALGPQAAVPVALIFCFENAMHFTLAPLMMAIDSGSASGKIRLLVRVAGRIATHPFIIATILGITAAAMKYTAPVPVEKLLSALSAAAAPCALFAIGVSIATQPVGRLPVVMAPLLIIKLAVQPILAYVLVSWMGDFSPAWTYTAVLLAALPTAANVYVIAQQYNVWVERTSGMIVASTVLSMFTLSGLLYLITTDILPPDLFLAK